MNIPDNLLYTREHFWVKKGDLATCGITDYAQNELGDVIFVELPEEGKKVKQGDKIGEVESIKTVSYLYAPLSGEVMEVNRELDKRPELINQSPYGEGWICKIQPENEEEFKNLMNKEEYEVFLKTQ
ncbi:MAG TPA: glycine cleavage system protein GcvH [Candidatus Atribacteria bacterium]|uniref:glycine cleavage system protein GcvH n=1 Tax=Candidatus Sordicultor fermentans TaxID=1953203 RepID=UPI0016A98D00|nr:glycine cleavage system protein GcvH [Atribacterota bacterium]NLY04680.1 glycine cleavage system protein GcvH [Candidatus Atribacteria bacterium]HPT63891.1 glycine cleavage system protein GcvH [Candidatus Atribacteria bacterium]HPZ40021.1 glycine cleavage system protein GcvH [Candidatus Atribacteria bacterium]